MHHAHITRGISDQGQGHVLCHIWKPWLVSCCESGAWSGVAKAQRPPTASRGCTGTTGAGEVTSAARAGAGLPMRGTVREGGFGGSRGDRDVGCLKERSRSSEMISGTGRMGVIGTPLGRQMRARSAAGVDAQSASSAWARPRVTMYRSCSWRACWPSMSFSSLCHTRHIAACLRAVAVLRSVSLHVLNDRRWLRSTSAETARRIPTRCAT